MRVDGDWVTECGVFKRRTVLGHSVETFIDALSLMLRLKAVVTSLRSMASWQSVRRKQSISVAEAWWTHVWRPISGRTVLIGPDSARLHRSAIIVVMSPVRADEASRVGLAHRTLLTLDRGATESVSRPISRSFVWKFSERSTQSTELLVSRTRLSNLKGQDNIVYSDDVQRRRRRT